MNKYELSKQQLKGNRRKPQLTQISVLMLLGMYIGLVCGAVLHDVNTIEGEDKLDVLIDAIQNHLFLIPFPQFGEYLLPGLGIGAVAGLLMVAKYVNGIHTYMPGEEYGDARFATAREINKQYKNKIDTENKILSQNLRLSIDDRATGINNLMIAIGGAGSGKSFYLVKPNVLNAATSMIITDPKGELLRDTGNYLIEQGYNVKILNLRTPTESDHYNPFNYLKTNDDVVKLINNFISNTTQPGSHSSDPFWEKSESMFLQAIFFDVWLNPKYKGRRNFRTVVDLLKKAKIEEGVTSELDLEMRQLESSPWDQYDYTSGEWIHHKNGKQHPAIEPYKTTMNSAEDTARSILVSVKARMSFLMNAPNVLSILDEDDMDISSIGMGYPKDGDKDKRDNTKTALFCVIPDADTTFNSIVGMLYTQIFQELYFDADMLCGGHLPIPVAFWMDEFANVALPDGFDRKVTTMRSRGISCNIILQNYSQIKTLYEKSYANLVGSCDTMVFLGGNDTETFKYLSERMGNWTLDKRSQSESLGAHGSSSHSDDVMSQALMAADQLGRLENDKEIIFIRGQYPVKDYKYRTGDSKKWKHAKALGDFNYAKYRSTSVEETIEGDWNAENGSHVLTKEESEKLLKKNLPQVPLSEENLELLMTMNVLNNQNPDLDPNVQDVLAAMIIQNQETVEDKVKEKEAASKIIESAEYTKADYEEIFVEKVFGPQLTKEQKNAVLFAMSKGIDVETIRTLCSSGKDGDNMLEEFKKILQNQKN